MTLLRSSFRLALAGALLGLASGASAYPANPGGVGGPYSGAGVRPGVGVGAPGAGVTRAPGVDPVGYPANPGGVGGPYSGAGVRPGIGVGAPGAGVTRAPGDARPIPAVSVVPTRAPVSCRERGPVPRVRACDAFPEGAAERQGSTARVRLWPICLQLHPCLRCLPPSVWRSC